MPKLSKIKCEELLTNVKAKFKKGEYTPDLLKKAERLFSNIEVLKSDEYKYIQAASFCFETFHLFGKFYELESTIQKSTLFDPDQFLPPTEITSLNSKKLARETIKLKSVIAYNIYFRQFKFAKALLVFESLQKSLENIISDEFQCYNTRSKLFYYLSNTYRELADYVKAEEHLKSAISLYRSRLESRRENLDEVKFSSHRLAILMFSLARLRMEAGTLSTAITALDIASILLASSNDSYTQAQVEMLTNCIQFRLYADQPEKIERAISKLQLAENFLSQLVTLFLSVVDLK